MTFPLGSLRGDGCRHAGRTGRLSSRDGARPRRRRRTCAGLLRAQLRLLAGGVLWLLALLALATHSAADAAFSTSGSGGAVANKAGIAGRLVLRLRVLPVRLFGLVAAGGRRCARGSARWRACCAASRAPRRARRRARAGAGCSGSGLALLLAASAALEWTRLYQWEARVAGGHAGGVLGYTLGHGEHEAARLRRLGRVVDRRAGGGHRRSRCASRGCAWPKASAPASSRCATRRVERIERAEDARLGEQALREREQLVEVEHAAAGGPCCPS